MIWDDFDAAVQESSTRGGTRCSVGKFLDALSDEGRKAVESVIDNPNRQSSAIAKALQRKAEEMCLDVRVPSQENLGRHRRHECRCHNKAGA